MTRRVLLAVLALALVAPTGAHAIIPDGVPDLTILGQQALRGNDLITSDVAPVAPTPKVIDGDISDWTGDISRYGGTAIYSRGEYVYQDYINDSWGADDGQDAARAQYTDALNEAEARTYRAEALSQAAGEQLGAPGPETISARANYGNVTANAVRYQGDIEEVRVAADANTVSVMVRTLSGSGATGVVVLLDQAADEVRTGPGNITTTHAFLLANGGTVLQADGITGAVAASNASGYTNATEIAFDRPAGTDIDIAVATCVIEAGACKVVRKGDAKADLLNVAFRFDEPARIWMDHDQAFALRDGNIDGFTTTIDLDRLVAGTTQTFAPRPGYWERIYVTDSPVNFEGDANAYHQGIFQHYGVYLPTTFRAGTGTVYPTTWWAHYRGGHAHDAAAWVPGLLRQLGEAKGNIMIFPSARGTSSWYVGRGMEDFLDVWDDSAAALPIDPDRVAMTGYSMGGFASWLLPLLMPDRFAAASPQEGPPTQGLFAGVGPNDLDPSQPQNGGDVQAELLYNIVENARNLSYVTYHGTNDELVPITGIARMHARFTELGYRNRLYALDGAEHYTPAILDRWEEAANYIARTRRSANPERVTYRTWPALEHAASTINNNGAGTLGYRFNAAYWVSDLNVRNAGTPIGGRPDPNAWGTIDAQTFGYGTTSTLPQPEASVGEQGVPYQMAGLAWQLFDRTAPENRFTATLENLSSARLDVARMGLTTSEQILGTITTDGPTTVTLYGATGWSPTITVAGVDGISATKSGGVITITIPAAGKGLIHLAV